MLYHTMRALNLTGISIFSETYNAIKSFVNEGATYIMNREKEPF